MSAPPPPPPPPPPHSSSNQRTGLPDGPYDIFIVPPHSSGGGFIYFPSLQTNRNSFIAGVASTLLAVLIWSIILPAIKDFVSSLTSGGGVPVIILLLAVGVAGWAWGKGQMEGFGSAGVDGQTKSTGTGPKPYSSENQSQSTPRATPSWQRTSPGTAGGAKSVWEKAREETRRKEEERKRAEEAKKRREEDERERTRQREKDAREREGREGRARSGNTARSASPNKARHATAKTATDDDAYSFRPYDEPKPASYKTASSIYSESSYAPSQSTSHTSPPPSHRAPYQNSDPDKISIKAVYSFNNTFTRTPIAKLVSGAGTVTDGLILRITTEGLFIDDDVRGVPQREWDVKAWTLKLVENGDLQGWFVLRASIRDLTGKRYVFILQHQEQHKLDLGLARLRKGSQVRALGMSGMPANEVQAILENTGWI